MAAGLHAVNLANVWLNILRNVTGTAVAQCYVALHTGNPGSAGTSAASAETDRKALNFSAASGGVLTSSNAPQWATWDAGTETISYISVWDASTSGNFLLSIQLTASKTVSNGDTLNLTASGTTITLTPIAS